MKLKDAYSKTKKTTANTNLRDFDSIEANLNAVKQQVDRLKDATYSLWNSLIAFNGILIAIMAVVLSLNPSVVSSLLLRDFLTLSIGAIIIFVLNFKHINTKLDMSIKKELDIIDLKIKGINVNALYGPSKPNNKRKIYSHYYDTIDRWIKFIVKKSENFALILTLVAVIYIYVIIFKVI